MKYAKSIIVLAIVGLISMSNEVSAQGRAQEFDENVFKKEQDEEA